MVIHKETKYSVELTQGDVQALINEMNTIYPLFASEGDVSDIKTLLQLKDELAMAANND